MKPYKLLHGDNRQTLKTLPDNSVDAIVTDPPYELGFMGKAWDATGIAYDAKMWGECLRVLKPGGHLLAFSGSRTYHRMACAIEDAGFEIRDQMMWVYGSSFPKSMNIGKALDKSQGENRQRQLSFTRWMISTGIKAKQINEATNSSMSSHYLTEGEQPAIATADMFDKIRHLLPTVPEYIERLVAERTGIEWTDYAKRLKTGERKIMDMSKIKPVSSISSQGFEESLNRIVDTTLPASELSKKWDGWGTTLKPAHEPIVLARKQIDKTVAQNVRKWGVGGLNIEGCRISYDSLRRFPANLMHDGSQEVLDLFPGDQDDSAARFFYCPKASKKDRDEGNNHPTVKPTELMRYLCRLITPPDGLVLDPFNGSGSTGKAAILEGFTYIGCEMSEEYIAIATARIEAAIASK